MEILVIVVAVAAAVEDSLIRSEVKSTLEKDSQDNLRNVMVQEHSINKAIVIANRKFRGS